MKKAVPKCLWCEKPLSVYAGDQSVVVRTYDESEADFEERMKAIVDLEYWEISQRRARIIYLCAKKARRGVFGLGLFHSKECAAQMGVAAAKAGYRRTIAPRNQ